MFLLPVCMCAWEYTRELKSQKDRFKSSLSHEKSIRIGIRTELLWFPVSSQRKEWKYYYFQSFWGSREMINLIVNLASLVAQMVKNLPAMQETWVWYLDWEDPLEKGMATHSSTLAQRILWTDHGVAVRHNWVTNSHTIVNLIISLTDTGQNSITRHYKLWLCYAIYFIFIILRNFKFIVYAQHLGYA